ncbi:MAG TPA: TetR/AcrR family transcriptional regulator [Solirubrobacteraceae bacterium]|nr:TetR/AcrR family transcriptional regulator [Solirubrobacteraceae bacterium]
MSAEITPRPYRQGARAQAAQRTRAALLEAADEEFYEGRWQSTSLTVLAKRAGVTKQTLLRHFGSKEELLLQALVQNAGKVLDERWSAPSGDIGGVVENLLAHYESWGERSMRMGAGQGGPRVLAEIARVARQVHYNWVEFAFAPQLKGLRGRARARRRAALIALCDVQTWWVLSHDLALPRAEVHRILVELIEGLVAEPK